MTETKQFTRFEKSQIINTAKVLKGFFAKKDSLEKKIKELKKEMLAVDEQQKRWEAPIMDLLGGHRLGEVVEYKKELQPSGKYATKISLRYPETVLPPVVTEPECPTHEFGNDFDEDRSADVDEDMQGEFAKVPAEHEPEQDSAGFSTKDGLQEGEPAELAEKVNNPNPTAEEREAMEQSWEEEKAQADQMIDAFAEGIDNAVNAVADTAGSEEDDPFFLG